MLKDKHQVIDLQYHMKIDEIDVHEYETTVFKDYLKELNPVYMCMFGKEEVGELSDKVPPPLPLLLMGRGMSLGYKTYQNV